jgi:hypothetical protein
MNGRITSHDIGLRIASGQTIGFWACRCLTWHCMIAGREDISSLLATSVHHWTRIKTACRLAERRRLNLEQTARLRPCNGVRSRHQPPPHTTAAIRRLRLIRTFAILKQHSAQCQARKNRESEQMIRLRRRCSSPVDSLRAGPRSFHSTLPSLIHPPPYLYMTPYPLPHPPHPIRPPVRPISKTCHPPPLHPPLPLHLLQSITSLLAFASRQLFTYIPVSSSPGPDSLSSCHVLTLICRFLHPS